MEAGEQFGAYRLIARIGAGGMGEVWKAEDVDLRRTVAIKILPAANAQDKESNERFKREARTAAQLNHPNIATIHAIDQNDDRAFIVMELVDGEPLSRVIRSGRMGEAEVAFVVRGVAEAQKGLSHIDRRQPLDAYESFKKVVSLEPTNAAGWVRTGELALFLESPQEAMGDFKKAAQIGEGLDQRDALTAEFGRAIADGDVAAMEEACKKAPFDRLYNELRRAAAKRGATGCPAPIGVGLEGGRRGPGSGPAPLPRPIRRP